MDRGARRLPRGLVTFVLTDLEGSTRLLGRLGEAGYGKVLTRSREILRRYVELHGGRVVDAEGDGCLAAFTDTGGALAACASVRSALGAEPWPDGVQVRLRMGVHCGLASPRNGRYVAMAVHQTARVAAAAHGGQVLVSGPAAAQLPDGSALVSLGRFRLRDFDTPVRLLALPETAGAVEAAGGAGAAPCALPAERHNLHRPLTPLVGRGEEVADLEQRLRTSPLVTVVGPGGVGKTRLVTEMGLRVAPDWPDGVWFVDLAPVEAPGLVAGAVAAALGVPVRGGEADSALLDHLRHRGALLLLDNCEHHAEAVARLVARLLATCPRVRVVATSRQPLHLGAERLLPLGPLPLPPPDSDRDAAAAEASPAVRLFTERAQAVLPSFRLDAESVGDVVALCRRLDGLPLALEIAAARMLGLAPSDVLAALDRPGSGLLRGRDVLRPERQRTLEALLDWSVRLLDPPERVALRRLALFGGPFGLEAATAAVAGPDADAAAVPELVCSLVERSLVVADPSAGGSRYRLLETVRRHARGLLEAHGETGATARRLADWYLDRVGPWCAGGLSWVGAVGQELDTLRALVPVVAAEVQEQAQQLACMIGRHHACVQTVRDGLSELTRLEVELPAPTPARVALLTTLGDLHLAAGQPGPAERCASAAEELARSVHAPAWDDACVAKTRGLAAMAGGDPALARAVAERALRTGLSLRGEARIRNLLGLACIALGDTDGAVAAFEAELRLCETLGDEVLLAHAYGNTAELALRLGDSSTAARHQRVCLELAVALGQSGMVAYSLNVAARLAAEAASAPDDWRLVVRLLARADVLLSEAGLTLPDDGDRRAVQQLLSSAREVLGAEAYADAWLQGDGLGLDEAVRVTDQVLGRSGARTPDAVGSTRR